ncbi:MAG: transposase, partial [Syntrophorhabdaceae bacterium]|nr:transposase [Syntrophorhabdaceae bacterium]
YRADTRQQALVAMNSFVSLYGKKFPGACECLTKDTDVLLAFYDFPAEHWIHIRSTNVIESTFATVRLRTDKTRGCGTRLATLTMVFKLAREARKTWKRLKGYRLIPRVLEGDIFIDGESPKEEERVA